MGKRRLLSYLGVMMLLVSLLADSISVLAECRISRRQDKKGKRALLAVFWIEVSRQCRVCDECTRSERLTGEDQAKWDRPVVWGTLVLSVWEWLYE